MERKRSNRTFAIVLSAFLASLAGGLTIGYGASAAADIGPLPFPSRDCDSCKTRSFCATFGNGSGCFLVCNPFCRCQAIGLPKLGCFGE
jgi:hypothetical protein